MKSEEKAKDAPEKGDAKKEMNYGLVGILVLAAMILVGLVYGYTTVTEKNRLIRVCNEIASSPDLKHAATCTPFIGDSNNGDYIDSRTSPMCKCIVSLENGTSMVIDVRVAKQEDKNV